MKAKTSENSNNPTSPTSMQDNVNPVSGLVMSESRKTVYVGSKIALFVTVYPSNVTNRIVDWTSSNPSVATVDNGGEVTAIAPGTAIITATVGGVSTTCNVTVKEKIDNSTDVYTPNNTEDSNNVDMEDKDVHVSAITLSESKKEMNIGEQFSLLATIVPDNATNKEIVWRSSNEKVATVANGKISAVSSGTAVISATVDNVTAICVVSVKESVVDVEEIKLNKEKIELEIGAKDKLTATVKPANASYKTITWKSSDTKVATVDKDGTVTANSVGTAIITSTVNNVTAVCDVTVKEADLKKIVRVSLPKTPVNISYYGFRDELQSTIKVTSVDYSVKEYYDEGKYTIILTMSGEKIYDAEGDKNSEMGQIGWKLYKGDIVVDSGFIWPTGLAVGDKFTINSTIYAYSSGRIDAGDYVLELLDVY